MTYKQYLHGALVYHTITGSKSNDTIRVVGLVSDEDTEYEEFRTLKVRFEENENAQADPDNMLAFSSGSEEESQMDHDYAYAKSYVKALKGDFPNRRLAEIRFLKDCVAFDIVVFNENKERDADVSVYLRNFPKHVNMIVTSDVDAEEENPIRYVVRNLAEKGADMRIEIEEYRNLDLLRTRELGKDEGGQFELITEQW